MSTKARKHALLSSSSSERWLNCPGSISILKDMPEGNTDTPASIEGTTAHECFEFLLKADPHKYLSAEAEAKKKWGLQMMVHASWAAKAVRSVMRKGFELAVETKCDLSHIHPEMGGHLDAAVAHHFKTLYIFDFKYGVWPVSAKENEQMITYGLAELERHNWDFQNVVLTILQPRVNKGKTIRSWSATVSEMRAWEEIFKRASRDCFKPKAPFKVGSWCYFCPARLVCPLKAERQLESAKHEFADIKLDGGF